MSDPERGGRRYVMEGVNVPIIVSNAFENPIKGVSPLTRAQEELQKHWKKLRELYSLPLECETTLPEKPLNQVIEELVGYVK